MSVLLKDGMNFGDSILSAQTPMPKVQGGLWARTQILGGHGIRRTKAGYSVLNEKIFDTHNMVPLGGVQYCMSRLFESDPSITVPTLYDQSGYTIGLPNKQIEDYDVYDYHVPATSDEPQTKTLKYPVGHHVCLFGIGITGTAENNVSLYPVSYTENSMFISKTTTDGALIEGTMIPFRYTSTELSESEQTKYFGRKDMGNGFYAYYLKTFESEPAIRHYYKTSDDDDYIDAVDNTVWNSVSSHHIDSFAEIVLKINSNDVKQWAEATEGISSAKVNTVALFCADYNEFGYSGLSQATGGQVTLPPDYQNVYMFSKLTIPTEPLELNKDLDIIYRVYGS